MPVQNNSNIPRRKFIALTAAAAGGSALMSFFPSDAGGQGRNMTIREAIDIIIKNIPVTPFSDTVDTVKSGNPDQLLKGIVTTSFATIEVIEKAAASGANFIVAHEPTFYNHRDETDWLQQDGVYQYKKKLLDKHGIVVWRFHDYWHSDKPDGVLTGVLHMLGWEQYADTQNQHIITIPGASFNSIAKHVKERMQIPSIKAIGDPAERCSRIVMLPGAAGGRAQIQAMETIKPDLLICGELQEWETSEYVRDARAKGDKMALMVLGHAVSEEPGMSWLVPWLQPKLPGITITHIPSKSPFTWY
ncbi:MAG TPA: Nif3-like dinuclear metal center hexameric protein [Agriterribacter sp.]|nr:Nif3-like dinuclear metal center hexameric protein [Agriterribacter sp.]